MQTAVVTDVIAMKVPARWMAQAELAAASGEIPDDLRGELDRVALNTVTEQYAGRLAAEMPRGLLFDQFEWLVTRDPAQLETFQPGDGCPDCVAGNEKARALLQEHPEALVALGNLRYHELWP